MNRQQSLLHHILDIRVAGSHAGKSPARHGPHRSGDFLQQLAVDSLVARQGGAHLCRPFLLSLALGHDGALHYSGREYKALQLAAEIIEKFRWKRAWRDEIFLAPVT